MALLAAAAHTASADPAAKLWAGPRSGRCVGARGDRVDVRMDRGGAFADVPVVAEAPLKGEALVARPATAAGKAGPPEGPATAVDSGAGCAACGAPGERPMQQPCVSGKASAEPLTTTKP